MGHVNRPKPVRKVRCGPSSWSVGAAPKVMMRVGPLCDNNHKCYIPQPENGRLNNHEIRPKKAASLIISESTVKYHLRNILDKLHLDNRAQAAAYAASRGVGGIRG